MAETLKVLALGDSLTAGYGLAQNAGFVPQLEKALRARGRDVTIINAGVSGDTSAGGLARLDWALADKPHAAIVELGANDGLRGLPPDQMYQNLNTILARLNREKVPVLLAGMLAPANYGPDYAKSFAAAYGRLAKEHGVVFYPFFLEGVAKDAGLNQGDGLHPNEKGVAEIVRRILPQVEQVLDQAKGRPG